MNRYTVEHSGTPAARVIGAPAPRAGRKVFRSH